MSPVWSSQGVVLLTAMAVSGAMIFLSRHRTTATPSDGNRDSSSTDAPPSPAPSRRRSCLSSVKKDGKMKKKVRFAEDVKDPDLDRKTWKEVEYVCNCGIETMDFSGASNLLVEFSR